MTHRGTVKVHSSSNSESTIQLKSTTNFCLNPKRPLKSKHFPLKSTNLSTEVDNFPQIPQTFYKLSAKLPRLRSTKTPLKSKNKIPLKPQKKHRSSHRKSQYSLPLSNILFNLIRIVYQDAFY